MAVLGETCCDEKVCGVLLTVVKVLFLLGVPARAN